jgi:tRNA 5-methylaminomethyl-2-thiouridine biosynthesis bifunctional protein
VALHHPFAVLDWTGPAGPRADGFGDVYFSNEDGLAETRAVFLEGCGFPEAFTKRRQTVVGELGFGTGLNFLALWQAFRDHAPEDARLDFVTVEGFPLRQEDAARALAAWPELGALARELLAVWPGPGAGAHRRVFEGGQVTLTVFHDEAGAALANMDMAAHAWFLDGFAPAKNPGMWSETAFARIAELSAPRARLATFTVAGAVRRGLQAAGFDVEKKPGHGRKRERLEAVLERVPQTRGDALGRGRPADGPVAIIGGGIAAASLAHALRLRGRQTVLIADGGLAAGASGGPQGLLTPRLEAADRPHVRALMNAFEHARMLYGGMEGFHPEGALRTGDGERLARIADLAGPGLEMIGADEAAARTGIAGAPGGLWIERAGRFDPAALVRGLAGEAPVIHARAGRVVRSGDVWRVMDAAGAILAEAGAVVIAGGAGAWPEGAPSLPLQALNGQAALFALGDPAPSAPLAWGHYVCAAPGGALVGATHERGGFMKAGAAADALRAEAQAALPAFAARLGKTCEVWRASRATLPDRLPAAGPLPSSEYGAVCAAHAKGGPPPPADVPLFEPGLFALTGLGARGFAHAPLLAEMIASDLCRGSSPMERAGRRALHPSRCNFRDLRRG